MTHRIIKSAKKVSETAKAIQVISSSFSGWIPKSLISSTFVNESDYTRFDYIIPMWFANKIGI